MFNWLRFRKQQDMLEGHSHHIVEGAGQHRTGQQLVNLPHRRSPSSKRHNGKPAALQQKQQQQKKQEPQDLTQDTQGTQEGGGGSGGGGGIR
ncbi:GL18415 [Drosophila persimilis]|uniref:GL18415 n=1 Tax=Drosophila persimilis TaxID=7234 RepID=B4HA72_DROPE|nr:GL18415 [Drosophila persimilis]